MQTHIDLIVKNKIQFMNLFAPTYHGQIRPLGRLPSMILTGLICPSDNGNYVLFIYHIIPFKNCIAKCDT